MSEQYNNEDLIASHETEEALDQMPRSDRPRDPRRDFQLYKIDPESGENVSFWGDE